MWRTSLSVLCGTSRCAASLPTARAAHWISTVSGIRITRSATLCPVSFPCTQTRHLIKQKLRIWFSHMHGRGFLVISRQACGRLWEMQDKCRYVLKLMQRCWSVWILNSPCNMKRPHWWLYLVRQLRALTFRPEGKPISLIKFLQMLMTPYQVYFFCRCLYG